MSPARRPSAPHHLIPSSSAIAVSAVGIPPPPPPAPAAAASFEPQSPLHPPVALGHIPPLRHGGFHNPFTQLPGSALPHPIIGFPPLHHQMIDPHYIRMLQSQGTILERAHQSGLVGSGAPNPNPGSNIVPPRTASRNTPSPSISPRSSLDGSFTGSGSVYGGAMGQDRCGSRKRKSNELIPDWVKVIIFLDLFDTSDL